MNTIHSSSLTHYPVAYTKSQAGRIDDSRTPNTDAGTWNPSARGELNTRPSSTELIQAALTETGLSSDNFSRLAKNSHTQKALNAYVQNYNQTAYRRVAEIVSGIDIYA